MVDGGLEPLYIFFQMMHVRESNWESSQLIVQMTRESKERSGGSADCAEVFLLG
jgi:hypothetical protein